MPKAMTTTAATPAPAITYTATYWLDGDGGQVTFDTYEEIMDWLDEVGYRASYLVFH